MVLSQILTGLLVFLLTLVLIAFYYVRHKFSYWKYRGVLGEPPSFPMGSLNGVGSEYFSGEIIQRIYNKFVGQDVIAGIYFFTRPLAIILDPELIKSVMVRDFSNFSNRGIYYNEKDDPLSAHLFSLESLKWRKLRNKMSPTFSSGKMKLMFDIVANLADSMTNYLKPAAERGDDIEFRDMFARYGTDVIANCAFGIECDSIKNPETEFRERSKRIFEPGLRLKLTLLLAVAFPKLAKFLKFKITEESISNFFLNVVQQNLKYRRTNNVRRNDIFQVLMDMEENNDNRETNDFLTFEEIAAQAFIFFVGGFETSSTTLSFCLFELGRNHDIQNKLRNEIERVIEKHGGVTYEAINDMSYMNQVVNGKYT